MAAGAYTCFNQSEYDEFLIERLCDLL